MKYFETDGELQVAHRVINPKKRLLQTATSMEDEITEFHAPPRIDNSIVDVLEKETVTEEGEHNEDIIVLNTTYLNEKVFVLFICCCFTMKSSMRRSFYRTMRNW